MPHRARVMQEPWLTLEDRQWQPRSRQLQFEARLGRPRGKTRGDIVLSFLNLRCCLKRKTSQTSLRFDLFTLHCKSHGETRQDPGHVTELSQVELSPIASDNVRSPRGRRHTQVSNILNAFPVQDLKLFCLRPEKKKWGCFSPLLVRKRTRLEQHQNMQKWKVLWLSKTRPNSRSN